ncbi:ATPase AAA [Spirochaetia bacterium]|nr:ATPase AAA [Spirochaetia bacterium]
MVNQAKKVGDLLDREVLPEQEYECPKHGKYKGMPVKLEFLDHAIDPSCPKCEEEERIRLAADEDKRQEEERQRQREQRLSKLNIGKRFWDTSFETFNAYTDELIHHLEICVDFAHTHNGRKLVMLGNNGTGKNHLAASILKITGGVIHTVYEIELMLHQSYSGETQEWNVLNRLCNTEMLIIDEIGRTKGGDWELNWLSYVINKRHENLLPLVLISNNHLKENCPHGEAGCPRCIQNYVGNDILSRIIEDGLIMEFTGDDYRERIRTEKGAGN